MSYPNTNHIVAAALLFGGALIAQPGHAQTYEPPAAKEGFSYPDVYCTNRGNRVEVGSLSCLKVGGKAFVARCGMSLNNPMWRKVSDGCPAQLENASTTAPASAAKPADGVDR
jgi:hypothetical protein